MIKIEFSEDVIYVALVVFAIVTLVLTLAICGTANHAFPQDCSYTNSCTHYTST